MTTYTYDDAGNLLTRRDDNGHTTTYAYDDAGRLLSETGPDPDGGGRSGGSRHLVHVRPEREPGHADGPEWERDVHIG